MKHSDLTWEQIKELADMAMKHYKDFQLNRDMDGYLTVEITTPTRSITKSEFEYVPVNAEDEICK